MSQVLALGGKSRRCNNFGSYGWYKRRGERVDFMPAFDPKQPSCVRLRCDASKMVRRSLIATNLQSLSSADFGGIMRRRELIAIIAGCLVWPFAARGQQTGKMFHIGWVSPTDPKPIQPFIEAFVSGLNALGYVQGQNIVYDIRYAENDPARLPVLIDELISLSPTSLWVSSRSCA
jgi:hypothetical protein